MSMSVEQLQAWLEEHISEIIYFMDYETTIESEEELADTLDAWFDSTTWRDANHRFIHLGIDGRGSQIAAWRRAGDEDGATPVVFFGSEGERYVLAGSPLEWAQMIAYAPALWNMDEPMSGFQDDDDFDEDDDEDSPKTSLEAYRAALQESHGALPPFESLRSGLDGVNHAFCAWVDETCGD